MMKTKLIILLTLFFSTALLAQGETAMATETSSWATTDSLLGLPLEIGISVLFLVALLILILIFLFFITVSFGRYTYNEEKKKHGEVLGLIKVFGIFEGDYTALTSKYQDVVIHEYDGIQEYDNDLPPWWKIGFYITIVWGVLYLFFYHINPTSFTPLQEEAYAIEMAEAEVKYANVDQVYEGPSDDVAILENSKGLFIKSCKACHGTQGEGGVGPNLTDKYWLHGGDVNKVYHTIKYGVVEKGMKAWKSDYSNQDIYGLASYIITLQGTNPPGAKDPQGELEE